MYKWIGGRKPSLKSLAIKENLYDDKEFWYLVGVLHGDGYVSYHNSSGCLMIAVKDDKYAIILKNLIQKLFSYEPRIKKRDDCSYVCVYTLGIVDIFSRFKSPGRWDVSEEVLSGNNDIKASYIRGLFDTDGHVAFYPRNDEYGRIDTGIFLNIDNTSASLNIQKLLKSLGILSRYYLIKYKKDGKNYKIDRIVIKNQTHVRKFVELIGFSHPRKAETLMKVIKSYKDVNVRYFDTKVMILDVLKEQELSTQKISNKLKRSDSTIREHLQKLLVEKKIEKREKCFNRWGVCKKSMYKKYIWRIL